MDVLYRPFGFRPIGGAESATVAPAKCACGITAVYNSPELGLICEPCLNSRDTPPVDLMPPATGLGRLPDRLASPAA